MCSESGTENIWFSEMLANIANLLLGAYCNSVSERHIMKSACKPVYLKSLMPF